MARMLSQKHDDNEIPMLASLREYLKPGPDKKLYLFMVIDDDKVRELVDTIESVVGDLSAKDTGIVFHTN